MTTKADMARSKILANRKTGSSKAKPQADGAAGKATGKKPTPKPKTMKKAKAEKPQSKPAPEGHNRPPASPPSEGLHTKALKSMVSQIEEYEAERKDLSEDIKDILAHAKDTGFNVRAIRKVISLRKQDKEARDTAQQLVDEYMFALGDR